MLKQSPSRIQRSRGFKVKHFLQICLLFAICIWLLNQLKHSYDKKDAYNDNVGKISENKQSKYEIGKFGRKDLHPRVDESGSGIENQVDKSELEEEIEELKPEDVEDDARGGGDDEIDGHDQDRAEEEESEEVEDLIDVDDRDRDVVSEEQESEEKSDPLVIASNDRARNEGGRISLEAREEHNDASSFLEHKTRTLSTEFEIGALRKIKVTFELSDHGNVHCQEKDNAFDLSDSYLNSKSSLYAETSADEKSEVKLNSRILHIENSGYQLPEMIQDSNATTIGEYTSLQPVSGAKNRSLNGTVESRQSNVESGVATTASLW